MFKNALRTLLAVALLALVAPPAQAWHTTWLTVVADGSASVGITLRKWQDIETDTSDEETAYSEWPRITGGRDLAGFVVTDERGEVLLYDVVATVRTAVEVPTLPGERARVERARMRAVHRAYYGRWGATRRYTITVLGDAPVTVKIPVRHMPARTLRATRPVAATRQSAPFLPTATEPRGEARIPITVRPASMVLLYTDHSLTGVSDGAHQWLCVVAPGAPCGSNDAVMRRHYRWVCLPYCVHYRNDTKAAFHLMVRPGATGRRDAVAGGSTEYGVLTDQRATAIVIG